MARKTGLGVVATGLVVGLFVIAAFARCDNAGAAEFIYLLGDKELKAGESKEVEKSWNEAPYSFNRNGGGLSIECKSMSPINESYITGGKPGVSFMTLEWTSCSGTSKGNLCKNIEVITPLLRGELVEQLWPSSFGFPATMLSPAFGTALIYFNMECEGVGGEERVALGSFHAEPWAQCGNKEEVGFNVIGAVRKVKTLSKDEVEVKTTLDGAPLLITGATNFKLKEKGLTWGIC